MSNWLRRLPPFTNYPEVSTNIQTSRQTLNVSANVETLATLSLGYKKSWRSKDWEACANSLYRYPVQIWFLGSRERSTRFAAQEGGGGYGLGSLLASSEDWVTYHFSWGTNKICRASEKLPGEITWQRGFEDGDDDSIRPDTTLCSLSRTHLSRRHARILMGYLICLAKKWYAPQQWKTTWLN